jgi:predicted glutamine amidotransferase
MCGIMGIVGVERLGQNKTISFMEEGLVALSSRGKDSTGMWHSQMGGLKSPVKAKEFLEYEEVAEFITEFSRIKTGAVVLGHCRAQTHGDASDNENNHPILSNNWVIMHNGIVDIDDVEGYDYQGETDTERFLSLVQTSKRRNTVDRIAEAVEKTKGSLAVTLVNRRTKDLWVFREGRPLVAGLYKNKVLLLSSTQSILEESIQKFNDSYFKGIEIVELPDKEILKIKSTAPYIEKFGEAETARKTYVATSTRYGYGTYDWREHARNKAKNKKQTTTTSNHPQLGLAGTDLRSGASISIKDATKLHCLRGGRCIHLDSSNTFCAKVGQIRILSYDKCTAKMMKTPRKMRQLAGKMISMDPNHGGTIFKLGGFCFHLRKEKDKHTSFFTVHLGLKDTTTGKFRPLQQKIYGIREEHTKEERDRLEKQITRYFYPIEDGRWK